MTISSTRSAIGDECTSQVNEGQVMIGPRLPSDPQCAKVVMPAVRPLDDPAPRFASHASLQGRLTTAPDMGDDPAQASSHLAIRVVISLVETQIARTTRPSRCAKRDRIQRRSDQPLVVDIRSRYGDRERNAAAIGQDMAFGTEFGPIGGVGAREVPPFGAFTLALSREAHCQSMPRCSS